MLAERGREIGPSVRRDVLDRDVEQPAGPARQGVEQVRLPLTPAPWESGEEIAKTAARKPLTINAAPEGRPS
ncbi:MAG: hypothetical protein ACRD0K_14280 [Egibacteraceae bacterium]